MDEVVCIFRIAKKREVYVALTTNETEWKWLRGDEPIAAGLLMIS